MRQDCVREGEGLAELSARLGVPGCMLLRANRLYSPAWLLPGREIAVPEGDFCRIDNFRCPVDAVHCRAGTAAIAHLCQQGDTVAAIAKRYRLPERLVLRAGGLVPGARLRLPVVPAGGFIVTALPGDSAHSLAARFGVGEAALRGINALWGAMLPGMRILIPERIG